jgi:hypothetical protein
MKVVSVFKYREETSGDTDIQVTNSNQIIPPSGFAIKLPSSDPCLNNIFHGCRVVCWKLVLALLPLDLQV